MGISEITILGIFGFTMITKIIIIEQWNNDIKKKNARIYK